MEYIQRVRKTDLARNTHQIIRNAQRGQTILVESHGQAEVAILDILDYRIVRAFLSYHTHPPQIDSAGLNREVIETVSDPQHAYDLVLAHYLAGAISLGRAAELLGLPPLDLQTRFMRLDVPLHLSPQDEQSVRQDINAAR